MIEDDIEVEVCEDDETYECGICHQIVEPDWVAGPHECFTEGWDGPLVDEAIKVLGYGGIAWRVSFHNVERAEVVAVMVGDDRRFTHDTADITVLDELEFCGVCGQIGCGHDGKDRG